MHEPRTEKLAPIDAKPIRALERACYFLQPFSEGAIFRIYGCVGGTELMPSKPIGLDRERRIFETKNTIYNVVSWGTMTQCIDNFFWTQIESDMKRGFEYIFKIDMTKEGLELFLNSRGAGPLNIHW